MSEYGKKTQFTPFYVCAKVHVYICVRCFYIQIDRQIGIALPFKCMTEDMRT